MHPRSLCLYLTWQLSAKRSSHGMSPFIVYTSFECVQLWYLLLPPPKHYLTTLVVDFSLSFGFTGPGYYSIPSSARSAKKAHVSVKKTSTPIFLTCSTHWLLHWWSRGSYTDDIRWRRLVYRLMMLKALLPFPVGTYLSTLFGSIYSCSRKTSDRPSKVSRFSRTSTKY